MKIQKLLPQITPIIIAVIALAYVIITPLGVAEGGGQYKFLESLGLYYLNPPTAEYFDTQYGVFDEAKVLDTHSFLTSLAIGDKKDVFDVKGLGLMFGLLLLLGLWLGVQSGMRSDRMNWALALLGVIIFADVGYLAYFNTLYYESTVLTTLILAVSMILLSCKKSAPIYLVLLCAVFSLAFACSGTLQAWVGIILGAIIARLCALNENRFKKAIAVVSGIVVVAISLSFALTYRPIDYEKNIFHSVFMGAAKHESVAELGLDPRLDELSGQFYSDGLKEQYNLNQEFFDKISYGKITKFYLTHPKAFVSELNSAIKNAYTLRPAYLGNFTEGSGREGKQAGGFGIYSRLKSTFVPNTFVFTFIFFIIYLGVLVYLYISEKEQRPLLEVFIGIWLSGLLCLKLPIIISGGFELGRALFTFNIIFDLMIIIAVVAGGRYMVHRRKNLQMKYGANQ